MQSLAVLALILGWVMLMRGLWRPIRRTPGEKKNSPISSEADIPPPTITLL